MKKYQFKKILKEKIKNAALLYLKKIKNKHKKMDNLEYEDIYIQNYFKNKKYSTKEKQLLFHLRTSMVNVRTNFSSMYKEIECNLCKKDLPQTSADLLKCEAILEKCPELRANQQKASGVQYDHIFNTSESVQLEAARLYAAIFKVKKDLDEQDP